MILPTKKMTVIEFARRRMKEADRQGEDDYIIQYWRAYLDGAESQRKEDLKRLEELNDHIKELDKQINELAIMLGVDLNAEDHV